MINNSKQRLFEIMDKVNGTMLVENDLKMLDNKLSRDDKVKIIRDFIKFVKNKLDFNNGKVIVDITFEKDYARTNKSFGGYMPYTGKIRVSASNRNLADVLRTLGHEIVHHWQNSNNRISDNSGDTGSDIENEANSLAGIYLREFGKINPDIYE